MAQYFNISGELTQQLLTPGDDVTVSKISLTNTQKVSKCKVDLYIEKARKGKFYLMKGVELPIGATLVYDDVKFNNATGEFGLYIKLTDGASFELTGDINPGNSTTTVPGTNTVFLSEISIGDELEVTGETKTVTAIASDTSLTVDTTYSSALATDTTPTCNPKAFVDVIIN
tara:strand:+ start:901 stop:1416 length:516 start_codon:yes stop_codon:yes gene_type:complete